MIHKYKTPKLLFIAGLLFATLLLGNVRGIAAAESASMNLTSTASSVTIGNSFVVTVMASSDPAIMIAQAKVTYNPANVSLQGVSYDGSAFDSELPETGQGNGYFYISRFKTGKPYPNGNMMIAKLTFKAIKDTGSAGLDITKSESALYSFTSASDILTSTSGVNVVLAGVPTNPSGGGSGGSGSSGGGGSSSGGTTSGGGSSEGGSAETPPAGGGSSDPTTATPVQPGSVFDPAPEPAAVITKNSGVDGLAITKFTKQITIGVTAAIALGAGAYLIVWYHRRNAFRHLSSGTSHVDAVVYDGSSHSNTEPKQPPTPPSNIITPKK